MKRKISVFLVSVLITVVGMAQENCSNAVDDDSDGLIDLNDPDCVCNNGLIIPNSYINNPNFEEFSACPSDYSELSNATGWSQPSDATPDFLHTCDFVNGWVGNANLLPFPSGNGVAAALAMTDWREYIATCLNTPLLAGTSYTLKMFIGVNTGTYNYSNPSDCYVENNTLDPLPWAIFGQPNCADNNFMSNIQGIPYVFCPPASEGFIELSSAVVPIDGQYHEMTFTFIPTVDLNGLVVGPGCILPPGYPDHSSPCLPYAVIDSLILNETGSFGAEITSDGHLCTDDLMLTAQGVIDGGTYQWYYNGVALVGEMNDTLEVSTLGLEDGDYQLVYTVNGACSMNEFSVAPSIYPDVNANDKSICPGNSATLFATGATTYTWSPAEGLSATTGNQVTASPENTTTYILTGTSAEGCSSQTEVIVTVYEPPLISIVDPIETACVGDVVSYVAEGAVDYIWNGTIQNELTFTAEEGVWNYEVIGVDANGCMDTLEITLTVHEYPDTVLGNASPVSGVEPLTVDFTNLSIGADSYMWNFGNGLVSDDFGPVSTTYTEAGTYIVTLTGTNNGCVGVWTETILVSVKEPVVVLPNVFSPNGDGLNDLYSIQTENLSTIEGVILNRWGNVVYEFDQIDFVWDGKNVSDGVYTIIYDAISKTGEQINGHGFIHLLGK